MAPKTKPAGTAAARQARAAAMRAAELKKERQRRALWISATAVAVVVIIIGVFVAVDVTKKKSTAVAAAGGPASASVVKAVTSVPATTLEKVGAGSVQALPKPITAPALTADGKPRVVYIGAEYCPYCAAERWGMVIALSRFGTFTNLGQTTSSAQDVHPSTATLSFHGATYTSDYLSFTGVEETTNQRSGNGYGKLDTPTAADQALIDKYDAPPYVDANSRGAIPFVDIGGKYIISGASFVSDPLDGKTHDQIAAALSDPNSAIAKGIDGTANAITAALCSLTGNKPAAVCNTSVIKSLQTAIDAQK